MFTPQGVSHAVLLMCIHNALETLLIAVRRDFMALSFLDALDKTACKGYQLLSVVPMVLVGTFPSKNWVQSSITHFR